MHSAPSVTYPVGRSHFAGALLLGIWLSGASVVACWSLLADAWTWRHGLALPVLLASGGLAARLWWRQAGSALHWDGQHWQGVDQADGSVQVHLDLQRHLLLRWHGFGGTRWYWVERSALPQRWNDLRRAVYSRAKPDGPASAGAPGA